MLALTTSAWNDNKGVRGKQPSYGQVAWLSQLMQPFQLNDCQKSRQGEKVHVYHQRMRVLKSIHGLAGSIMPQHVATARHTNCQSLNECKLEELTACAELHKSSIDELYQWTDQCHWTEHQYQWLPEILQQPIQSSTGGGVCILKFSHMYIYIYMCVYIYIYIYVYIYQCSICGAPHKRSVPPVCIHSAIDSWYASQ